MNDWRNDGMGGMGDGQGRHGRSTLETELREAFDRAPWGGPQDDLDVEATWHAGRRRRTRKRAGALAVAGIAAVTVGATVWASGLMGGSRGPDTTVAAVIPDGMTTFVFAAPDAPDVDPSTISALTVPDPADLRGTSWTLEPRLWDGGVAADVVGADPATTTLSFGSGAPEHPGWGFDADGCGGGWFQEDLVLNEAGAFPPGGLGTSDQGCPPAAQGAEDFWIDALSDGGRLHELGNGGWLLLSVELPVPDAVAPTGPAVTTDTVTTETGTATAEPTTTPPEATGRPTDETTDGPTDGPTRDPSGDGPTTEPNTEAPAPSPAGPTGAPPADDGPAFRDPAQEWVDEPWPAAGGGLFVPTVRAGVHDGFDRIVLDITGTVEPPWPGWRAAYTDTPTRDGSGLPVEIAGDSFLVLTVNGMAYPEPGDPVYDDGDFGLDTHRLGAVVEVIRATPFEGQLDVYLGITGEPRPYRTFLLQDPMRLVIDVQH